MDQPGDDRAVCRRIRDVMCFRPQRPPCQLRDRRDATSASARRGLQNEKSRALPKIRTPSTAVEWPARIAVDHAQGVESAERQPAQGVAPTCYHRIELA